MDREHRNRVAQWVFDTRPILGRFHLWLEDVEEGESAELEAFVGSSLARSFVMAAAVTALGTRLFGRYGEGEGLDKVALNRVKKDADAVSAYALSEALWYLTRNLPENHAVMVSLGEGLMPKAGETPEMGSNPLLGFGRVYARPQVARFLDRAVHRLINDPATGWDDFWRQVQRERLTIWGAAIDTLENTSRFAKGEASGPMTVLHLYDQPLQVSTPYEGYLGNLVLPRAVIEHAAGESMLITYHTPRRLVMEAIRGTYPDIAPERIHVWTLGGASRQRRLGALWEQWRELGAHVVEDGWRIPGGGEVFTDSGTYAPTARVGVFEHGGERHLFLCDGYAASAEAIQGASLDPILDNRTAMSLFSATFSLPVEHERRVAGLDPDAAGFADELAAVAGEELTPARVEQYRGDLRAARAAGLPADNPHIVVDDLLPGKSWRVLAVDGFMLPDPYSGAPGIEQVEEGVYRVTVRAATRHRLAEVTLTLRLMETFEESRLVFSPLLDRFYAGEDYRSRAVKVSDSGRLRNELQTLCSDGLEHSGDDRIRLSMDRVPDAVLPPGKKRLILEVLRWYKQSHPAWFEWLEIADGPSVG